MQQNDLALLLLGSVTAILFLLVAVLIYLLTRSTRTSQTVLLTLLAGERKENQSLRNQVRAVDLPSLYGLQQATIPDSPSDANETYTPSYEEGVTYQEALQDGNYVTEGVPDDLNAAGWNGITRSDSGGSPVRL